MQRFRSQSRLVICKPASPQIPILLACILFLNFSLVCPAAVIKVPQDYSTIQSAIDAAHDGDEIVVSPGTYYENLNFNGKNIILRSTDPTSATVASNTVIDGRSSDSVVRFAGTENETCTLLGFTITNGYAPYGAGIYGNGTIATIQNNIISGNTAEYYLYIYTYGGGLYDCDGTIQNNIVSDNSAGGGGLARCDGPIYNNTISRNTHSGLYDCDGIVQNNSICHNLGWHGAGLRECDGTIKGNIISDNSAESYGGGIAYSEGTIKNNIISRNSAKNGGGLSLCSGTIQNNTISDNSASHTAGGLHACDGTIQNNTISGNSATERGGGIYYCRGLIMNCIVWANSASMSNQLHRCSSPFYSCIQDWTGEGRGNITSDPKFVHPEKGNYHLQPTSPCINAGNTYYLLGEYITDVDGQCRVVGGAVDMGSDEYGGLPDSDGDLLSDINELTQGSDPNNRDTDGDGLKDGVEVLRGTNPTLYDNPTGISIPAHYSSIQQGLFLAFPSEVVTVSPGTYNENLHFLGKNCILQSTDPLDDNITSNTIVDGNGLSCVMFFEGMEDSSCAVRGLTIRNGYVLYWGGGIRGNETRATFEYNKICGNYAFWYGGGFHLCHGSIKNNTISDNRCAHGGGGLSSCDGIIENNTILNNSADYGGGLDACHGIIQNNAIFANSAGDGGGLARCDAAIQNNTIWGNSAQRGGGGLFSCNGTITNCIIWQNTAGYGAQLYSCSLPSFSCIQDWTGGGTTNISSDPQLVDPDNGDFHLKPTSPCIDAGGIVNLAQDFEGDPRPWDGTSEPRGDGSDFDIGADEYMGPISFDFTSSQEEWTTGTAAIFSEPQCVFEPGRLKLISQTNTNTFGYWSSPENAIPVTKGYLYRARFIVSTDVAQPEIVPQIRLRVNSENFQQADCLVIDSNGDGGASPTPEGKVYDFYFLPPANGDFCMLAFDLLNFNPYDAAHAELALESVLVERFALDTLDDSTGTSWTYDFETTQEFWFPGDGTYAFTDPEFIWDEGALHLRSMTNTNTFGFWHSDGIDVIVEDNRLYRGTFEVRTDEPERSLVPQMRLRFNTANMQAARTLEISSIGDGANSPGTTNTIYDRLYFLPPANCVGRGLIISFDMLNFDPDDAAEASLILDRAIIETLLPPTLP